MVVGDEPVEGGLRAGLELGDQFGFVTAPREGAGPIGHAVPFCGGEPSGLHLFRRLLVWTLSCSCDVTGTEALSAQLLRHRKQRTCFLLKQTLKPSGSTAA